ncbi:hypothetical protein Caka_3054 [Coraliomargarita akajimensis DSM 45221]|uniref:Uncharacterized protein n=1 Tax=Coraliomargarita akajimensis (strain DSM 45221 / IAM 15411 / JCM 23193 / KCTC 12865 / 04OKA010-24) TaxID=583355 RepID=D5EI27_CORAD|nr:hypothetical protein Caka_3054 [Coraliomargarita akajimensis DSM 45221]
MVNSKQAYLRSLIAFGVKDEVLQLMRGLKNVAAHECNWC